MADPKSYSGKEKELIEKINQINDKIESAWQKYREENPDAYGVKKTCGHETPDCTVPDGFYPNYTKQPIKILFVGREAYDLTGADYIDVFIHHYLNGTTGPEDELRSINSDKFHKMLIKVAYGIIHNLAWDEILPASKICEDGKIFDRVSFAFMNLSKLSNDNTEKGHRQTDWALVNTSLNMTLQSENLILEEISNLDPDLIICMNFERDRLQRVFGSALKKFDNDWLKYTIDINGKNVLLLDQWHFSAPGKSEGNDVYNPIYQCCIEQPEIKRLMGRISTR